MTPQLLWQRMCTRLREDWRILRTFHPSDRSWPLPLAAALAVGLPMAVGAAFHHPAYGIISSLGGMVMLNTPDSSSLTHRMVTLMCCAFGITACFALGLMGNLLPGALLVPPVMVVCLLVTMLMRYFHAQPPGGLFLVMAMLIGAYQPFDAEVFPLRVGLIVLGAILACAVAFVYSLYMLRMRKGDFRPPAPPVFDFDFIIVDSVVISFFVGLSLLLAQMLQMERPYWVPLSCMVVLQGLNLHAAWTRHVQRILGTGLGLVAAWVLLSLPILHNGWALALTMAALSFAIEYVIVRHYGLAMLFVTPQTIFLVEAAQAVHAPVGELLQARFFDTLLGCLVGFVGSVCLFSPRLRRPLAHALLRIGGIRRPLA